MERIAIPLDNLIVRPIHLWSEQWFLLAAGDYRAGQFNAMTVAWGSLGVMWNRPFAQIVVRPTRHTYRFTEGYPTFTLCAFPESCRRALVHCGTTSGRDGDKIATSGLTPMASTVVAAPSFEEAELVLECRTVYHDRFDPARFVDRSIDGEYPEHDYHGVYFGEIVSAWGVPGYLAADSKAPPSGP